MGHIRYHILSRENKKKKQEYVSEGIVEGKSVRNAFVVFKKWLKENGKELDKNKQYHFYQINHARIFKEKKGKFSIDSFYGNHKAPTKREIAARTKRLAKIHEERRKEKLEKENSKIQLSE